MESWQSIGDRSGSIKGLVQIRMLTKHKNVGFFLAELFPRHRQKNILSSTEEGRPFSEGKRDVNHIKLFFLTAYKH